MNTPTAFLPIAAALILTTVISTGWMAQAAEFRSSGIGPQRSVAQSAMPHYQSLTERLQKQWRVDSAVAEAHNLSTTGWETPACAPRDAAQPQSAVGNGLDRTEKCVQSCMKRTSLDNPNGILLCRSNCL